MSVQKVDRNQTTVDALTRASHGARATNGSKTVQNQNDKAKTDSVTISKQAQTAASQLPTRATEAKETALQEASETSRQRATETALGLD